MILNCLRSANRMLCRRGLAFSFCVLIASAAALPAADRDKSQEQGDTPTSTKLRSRTTSKKPYTTGATGETARIAAEIDTLIRQSWTDNEIRPSAEADDAEWIRRVHLDLVGHIPTLEQTKSFLADRDKNKRSAMIDQLIDSSDFVDNWTTIWTNLSIGRQTPRRTSRTGMESFYRQAFSENRPWNEVVRDIISAEGHYEENGAVNFLLAQMTARDEAVQATAKTTRLFMGIQVQCTQCHNHPFNKWKQDQFWEFNSFFRQARRIDHRKLDPDTGRMVDDYSELVNRGNVEGPVYFEKRSGLMQVAYPKYQGKTVDPGADTNRREVLAKLVTTVDESSLQSSGARPMIADALANRLWGHFLGFGFTRPVDDMGPHQPASHPRVLELLAIEFAKHNFDVRELMRWICNTEAYNLSSKFGPKNKIDDPAIGEMPLFSHVYMKQMNAEQLFDSLLVATNAHQSGQTDLEKSKQRRQNWLQQFVRTFGTDENDEATSFNGSIPQALMMMNGELIENAVSAKEGSFLHSVLANSDNDSKKITTLYLTALGRRPLGKEQKAAQQLINRSSDRLTGYQDLFWALLNSNEFILVH
ncbi:hypothetical protein CA54_49140 [Symmachiella macrocystis]|uniref:Cytochrome c domain-containing protein n=2 Tax=Symmachiella macrocystis TaxID=2527985 RepID=A0A5C6BD81_9PLAN|nr:hypothetical protein CA54_49140 [Symmachiella macrocystis]